MEKELKTCISIYSNIDANNSTSYEIAKRYCKNKIIDAEKFFIETKIPVLTTGDIKCESISPRYVKDCEFGQSLSEVNNFI